MEDDGKWFEELLELWEDEHAIHEEEFEYEEE